MQSFKTYLTDEAHVNCHLTPMLNAVSSMPDLSGSIMEGKKGSVSTVPEAEVGLEHVPQWNLPKLTDRAKSMVRSMGDWIKTNKPGNLHTRIASGVASGMTDITAAHPSTHSKHISSARKTLDSFWQSHGYKKAPKEFLRSNTKMDKTNDSQTTGATAKGFALAPARSAGVPGHTNCTHSILGCEKGCLATESGQNAIPSAYESKIATTHGMITHPAEMAKVLHGEIRKHAADAKEAGRTPVVRMGLYSELPAKTLHPIKKANPDVTFSDYAKDPKTVENQLDKSHPDYLPNVRYALSHTGANFNSKGEANQHSNDSHAARILDKGGVVAAVYKGDHPPTHYVDATSGKEHPAVDGDVDDQVHTRPDKFPTVDRGPNLPSTTGVVSNLAIKGKKKAEVEASLGHMANEVMPNGKVYFNKPAGWSYETHVRDK